MSNILNYIIDDLNILYLGLIVGLALLLTMGINFAFKKMCPKLVQRSKIWDESLLLAAHNPVIFLIWSFALLSIYGVIGNAHPRFNIVDEALARKFILVIFLVWFLLSLINKLEKKIIDKVNDHIFNSDITTVIALSQISRVLVIGALTLVFLQSMGISISALLAFGGVGALTVGFAAKDSLANLLGGLMIFVDRPFSVGDTIKSTDAQVDGEVEHIGWRLTRIRDTEMNARYVPNALFSTLTIINLSRIKSRRIKTTIKLRFQDMKELAFIVEEIKYFLQEHPEINQNQTIAVSLEDIGE
ncbi:MAG TPA: mechanosensitive ion channel domain-containing protein, partial [Coxiellaceae bacterium]|nr:mechanosensitive ion channel domain-containing protein [Coxiellaceae bacterium]